jgi:hypothetical protein
MTWEDRQARLCDEYLADVQKDDTRKEALDGAVEELVGKDAPKLTKQEAERAIALALLHEYVTKVRRRDARPRIKRDKPTRESLQWVEERLESLADQARALARYLDDEARVGNVDVIEPWASIMLRRTGVDVVEEAERLYAFAAANYKTAEAVTNVENDMPKASGGRQPDIERRDIARVCVQPAEQYGLLIDSRGRFKAFLDLFQQVYTVATGKALPDEGNFGRAACQQALMHWRAQAASGHKEGEHTP